MHWRRTAVESVRPSRFRPPFCPWPECTAHRAPGRGFHRHGFFRRKEDPRRIPRFLVTDPASTVRLPVQSTDQDVPVDRREPEGGSA